jgi:hypothetical protein
MKKQRVYLDTSVFGGYFDEEFQEFTKPLFALLRWVCNPAASNTPLT